MSTQGGAYEHSVDRFNPSPYPGKGEAARIRSVTQSSDRLEKTQAAQRVLLVSTEPKLQATMVARQADRYL